MSSAAVASFLLSAAPTPQAVAAEPEAPELSELVTTHSAGRFRSVLLETLSDGWVSHSTLARPAGKLFNGDHDRPALTLSLYQQYSVQVLKAKQRPGVPTTLPMFVISLLTAPTKVKRANALVFAVHVLMIPANVVTEKKGSGGAQPEPELELEFGDGVGPAATYHHYNSSVATVTAAAGTIDKDC